MEMRKLIMGGLVGLALTTSSAADTNDFAKIKDEFRFTRPNVVMYSNSGETTISNTNYTTLLSNYLKFSKEPDRFKTTAIMHGYMALQKRNGFEYDGNGTWTLQGVVNDLDSEYWALEGEYNREFEEIIAKFAKQEDKGKLR